MEWKYTNESFCFLFYFVADTINRHTNRQAHFSFEFEGHKHKSKCDKYIFLKRAAEYYWSRAVRTTAQQQDLLLDQ